MRWLRHHSLVVLFGCGGDQLGVPNIAHGRTHDTLPFLYPAALCTWGSFVAWVRVFHAYACLVHQVHGCQAGIRLAQSALRYVNSGPLKRPLASDVLCITKLIYL